MSHPVNDANESSPYGDLTREEFYKNHQILHKESFMLNQQNMKIFTQTWRLFHSPTQRPSSHGTWLQL